MLATSQNFSWKGKYFKPIVSQLDDKEERTFLVKPFVMHVSWVHYLTETDKQGKDCLLLSKKNLSDTLWFSTWDGYEHDIIWFWVIISCFPMLEFPQRTCQETVLTCDEHTLSTSYSSLMCSVETMDARFILDSCGVLPALPISQK